MEPASPRPSSLQPISLLFIAATCIVAGAVIGASTTAVNGAVSPEYFRNIMRWDDVENIWRASLAQGILEGLVYGVLFAMVFTIVVGRVSSGRCTLGIALRYLIPIVLAIYVCWAIGGVLAMGLATLSPEFYRRAFIGVPGAFGPMLRYAWVGGSIWGAMFGSLLAIVIGSVLFSTHWPIHHEPKLGQPETKPA